MGPFNIQLVQQCRNWNIKYDKQSRTRYGVEKLRDVRYTLMSIWIKQEQLSCQPSRFTLSWWRTKSTSPLSGTDYSTEHSTNMVTAAETYSRMSGCGSVGATSIHRPLVLAHHARFSLVSTNFVASVKSESASGMCIHDVHLIVAHTI